jgi:two-component system, NarL family, invasion response regulator UvrY
MNMRILLVEDHQLLRQGIIECLRREFVGLVFGEADSVREAQVQIDKSWDVVLLDLALPDGSGFNFLVYAKAAVPATKVIVLTASAENDCGLPALQDGADGFVMKTARFSDLAKAIRAVTEGRRYFSQALIEQVLNATSHRVKIASKFSARELDTLRLTAEGLSTGEIGHSLNISPKTVETYRARICQKLEIRGFASFVRFAILNQSHGYGGVSPKSSHAAAGLS